MPTVLFPTTVVGSYPQPDWLVNREVLKSIRVPRIHAPEIWRARGASSRRRRTTRPSSPSATWRRPVSTSSPTARSGGKATPIVSR